MKLSHIFVILIIILLALCGLLLKMVISTGDVMFYVTEGMIALSIAFVLLFYSRVLRPIRAMVTGSDLLAQQDFSSRLRHVGQYEVDRIVDVFNPMMDALKEKTLHMQEQSHLLNMVMEISPMGILVVDNKGEITYSNPSAQKMTENNELWQQCKQIGVGEREMIRLNNGSVYRCSCLAYMDNGFSHNFFVIESLTSELAEAERKAYEKVIRLMSHEVNNTVCGVNSTLEAVNSIISDEEISAVIEACENRTSALSSFISRFASVIKVPKAVTADTDINQFITNCLPILENMCRSAKTELRFMPDPKTAIRQIDVTLFEQVMINVVKNATESRGVTTITIETAPDGTITITDDGEGVSPEASRKMFSPFFTSKPGGQGLGLMLVRNILTDHGCRFSLATSPADKLTRFTIGWQ